MTMRAVAYLFIHRDPRFDAVVRRLPRVDDQAQLMAEFAFTGFHTFCADAIRFYIEDGRTIEVSRSGVDLASIDPITGAHSIKTVWFMPTRSVA